MTPRPVQHGGGVELALCSDRPEPPSVLRVRANCGGRLFTAKLPVVVHYSTRQVFDQLLADQAILMAGGAVLTLPPPIPVQRSHGFTRPTTRRGAECAPPTVKPLYLQIYFCLAAQACAEKPPPITNLYDCTARKRQCHQPPRVRVF